MLTIHLLTQETPGSFPAGEDPPEEGLAIHSSVLAWTVLMTEDRSAATVHEVAKELDMAKAIGHAPTYIHMKVCALVP